MLLGLYGKKLELDSKIVSLLKSYGFTITNLKKDNNKISEIYFDIGQWNAYIDILDETFETYLLNELVPLAKKNKILIRFVNKSEIQNLPAYRSFNDYDKLLISFILETGTFYKSGDTAKIYLEIKNISDKPIEFLQLHESLIGIRIDDLLGNELVYDMRNELPEPKKILLKPKKHISEDLELALELEKGYYNLIPMTTYLQFGKATSFYTMPEIRLKIE